MQYEMKNLIDKTVEILKSFGAKEIYIFGSFSKENMRENSDIDIAVSGLSCEHFFKAMGQVSETLHKPVDLIDLDEPSAFTQYLKDENELCRIG